MLNPNRVGMPFSRFGVKCMIARPDPLAPADATCPTSMPVSVAIEAGAATGPDDAFEVALLNAHTGASLASTIGLTHVTNPDGSRTYLVDLASIAAGICAGRQHNRYHFASC